jgi:hypothetical protein
MEEHGEGCCGGHQEEHKDLEHEELLESMSEKLGFTPHILEILGNLIVSPLKNITDAIRNYCLMAPCLQRQKSW